MARNENGRGFSLKDELFNQHKVELLADRFARASKDFSRDNFVAEVMRTMLNLELKARIGCIANALEQQLSQDFAQACKSIVAALPAPLDPNKTDDDFGDFIYAPLGEFVARHGATKENVPVALETLREITMRFSMEDAIRTFLEHFPEETLRLMQAWAKDEQYHVRRLVSEGTRPLLPWSSRLHLPQTPVLQLLDLLYSDNTRYVTRSVANHLNDISKSNPSLVVQTLARWEKEGGQDAKELDWMRKHALRTLIKKGDVDALALLGYAQNPAVKVSSVVIESATVRVGEVASFSFTVTAQADVNLMIDYVVDFVKAGGKRASKVYKIKQLRMTKGESVVIDKNHRFVAGATTLKYYAGEHALSPQINGTQYHGATFELMV